MDIELVHPAFILYDDLTVPENNQVREGIRIFPPQPLLFFEKEMTFGNDGLGNYAQVLFLRKVAADGRYIPGCSFQFLPENGRLLHFHIFDLGQGKDGCQDDYEEKAGLQTNFFIHTCFFNGPLPQPLPFKGRGEGVGSLGFIHFTKLQIRPDLQEFIHRYNRIALIIKVFKKYFQDGRAGRDRVMQ
jgi:hypothetical protein